MDLDQFIVAYNQKTVAEIGEIFLNGAPVYSDSPDDKLRAIAICDVAIAALRERLTGLGILIIGSQRYGLRTRAYNRRGRLAVENLIGSTSSDHQSFASGVDHTRFAQSSQEIRRIGQADASRGQSSFQDFLQIASLFSNAHCRIRRFSADCEHGALYRVYHCSVSRL